MSDVALDMATYLDAQGVGTLATDIFYDQMPDGAALPVDGAALAVIESGGFDPEINADRKHFNPSIQVVVKGKQNSNTEAKAMLAVIVDELTDPLNLVVGGTTYYSTAQVGGNNWLGYDDNDRPEWSLNFQLRRREDQ